MNNIYQKLIEIQKQVEKFVQDSKGFNYKYTSGSLVLSKIKPLMNQYGLLLKQEVLTIENTRMDYSTKTGAKSEVLTTVMLKFTWIDAETGETDVNLFGANGMNDFDKGFGSALTYAERYFMLKFFHIPTDEDSPEHIHRNDASTHTQTTAPELTAKTYPEDSLEWINDEQVVKAIDYIKNGGTMADIKAKYKISRVNYDKIMLGTKKGEVVNA